MKTDGRVVTFESYYDPMLAHIVRTRLEANGIQCFVADNNTVLNMPYYNQALGVIKLKVFEKDLDKCIEILAVENEIKELEITESKLSVNCPVCGSSDVRYGTATKFDFHFLSLLASLFFFAPLYIRNAWHCFNCHIDFK